MLKKTTFCIFLFLPYILTGKEFINPVIAPWFYSPDTEITVTYNVTGTPLASLTDAFAWVWIPGKNIDAKYNVNPANTDAAKTNNVKFVKSEAGGKTLFTLTFTPSALFDADISSESQFGILLKGNDWSNGQTTDFLAPFWDGTFQIRLIAPTQIPFIGVEGSDLTIEAETPVASTYELYIGGILVDTRDDVTQYSYTHILTGASNYAMVELIATEGTADAKVNFQIVLPVASPELAKPSDILPGINYDSNDDTKATLCLWAPLKASVYAVGEFSDWKILPEYLMKKDGEFFWLELNSLAPAQEYAFQYLVDESLYVADPYADKILDPDDQFIPAKTYPGLKQFPTAALKSQWYFNRLAVLQTSQEPYVWQTPDFAKPDKTKLVIYELLVRDFFESGERNYQNLIDTLGYLKGLGINAIELMPVTEFNGNDSWGYNPTFMFAPDKYYGTKNKLKEFIDECHAQGIAVILDVVMNQQDIPNPYVLMYFDFDSEKPTAENPWFNQEATHPFNVFFDMNHESKYTQQYLDTINYYWIHQYNFDGYRFDLSKGYTQKNAGGNVDAWGEYDASRITLLKRMADKIWEHSPDAYVILEHFADNVEEKELAEYKADEGKGMLLWGNYNGAYSQNASGNSGADFSSIYHGNRGWSIPHLIGYMESHDEERLMYRNFQNGKSAGQYNVKNLSTALSRMKAASLALFTIPGPKMHWQFGELGYDQSINRCPDGTISESCRVAAKPVHWEYRNDAERYGLYQHIAELLQLRNTHDVFTEGTSTITTGSSIVKQISIKNNPYTDSPVDAAEMNVHIVINFDVISKGEAINFPHTGAWFEYFTGHALTVSTASHNVTLSPGEYRMYTDYPLKEPVTGVAEKDQSWLTIFPNPVEDEIFVGGEMVRSLTIYTPEGRQMAIKRNSDRSWSVSSLPKGIYIVKTESRDGVRQTKIAKQ
jgi:pullulanase/glycogen debranching enzyme